MGTFRTPETEAKYDALKASGSFLRSCPLCNEREILKEFKLWKILKNLFPYDAVAKTHHMLVSKRHVSSDGLTEEEQKEFEAVKRDYVYAAYEFMIEPHRNVAPY
ncbi:MAG: hypothetical protein WBK28_03815, partial [Minisyncoccia bacterium]